MEDIGLEALAKLLMQAAQDKNGFMLLAIALVGAVYLTRKFLAKKIPFLQSQAGGSILVFVNAFAGMLITSLASGQPMSGAMALTALKIAFTAAGGWTLVKHLLSSLRKEDVEEIKAEAVQAGEKAASDAPVKSLEDIANGK